MVARGRSECRGEARVVARSAVNFVQKISTVSIRLNVRYLQQLCDVHRERSLSEFIITSAHANHASTLFFCLCRCLVYSVHQDVNSAIWMPLRLSLPLIYSLDCWKNVG